MCPSQEQGCEEPKGEIREEAAEDVGGYGRDREGECCPSGAKGSSNLVYNAKRMKQQVGPIAGSGMVAGGVTAGQKERRSLAFTVKSSAKIIQMKRKNDLFLPLLDFSFSSDLEEEVQERRKEEDGVCGRI
ncbi:hypothetical protein Tco_1154740 [Tanacetum coccineum]